MRFLSNNDVDELIRILNEKSTSMEYTHLDNYHFSLQAYNELNEYFQDDIIIGNWYIPNCLPIDLPMPDYTLLKNHR